jgi:hypothetical protein
MTTRYGTLTDREVSLTHQGLMKNSLVTNPLSRVTGARVVIVRQLGGMIMLVLGLLIVGITIITSIQTLIAGSRDISTGLVALGFGAILLAIGSFAYWGNPRVEIMTKSGPVSSMRGHPWQRAEAQQFAAAIRQQLTRTP